MAIMVFGRLQFAQPDTFHNPYTNIRAACMLVFALSTLCIPIPNWMGRRTAASYALVLSWLVFTFCISLLGLVLISMLMFIFP